MVTLRRLDAPSARPDSDALPLPALDHVVVNAREKLEAAAECYRRLGFHLTPMGRHTIGSINHLAVFATDYLELVGVVPGSAAARGDILRFPEGLNGLVFATDNAGDVADTLKNAGVAIGPAGEFSRPVELDSGAEDARFRVARLDAEAVPYGRVYFCQHLTRHLVWRDEWRHHPNGAIAVVRAVICSTDPDRTAALYRKMFGAEALRRTADGFTLAVGLGRFDIMSPASLDREFGEAAPDPQGRAEHMAALTFRTLSLDRARQAMQQRGVDGIQLATARLIVPATQAFGAILEFVE